MTAIVTMGITAFSLAMAIDAVATYLVARKGATAEVATEIEEDFIDGPGRARTGWLMANQVRGFGRQGCLGVPPPPDRLSPVSTRATS
jgi:hypothetical protein